MMKRRYKRLTFVVVALVLTGVATGLVLSALDDSIAFFKTPTDIATATGELAQRLRIGGLVETGSVRFGTDGQVDFVITDTAHGVPVRYHGLLPDLFREGQGVVANGMLKGRVFMADEILAKHDETYMPKEVVDALRDAGQWQGD